MHLVLLALLATCTAEDVGLSVAGTPFFPNTVPSNPFSSGHFRALANATPSLLTSCSNPPGLTFDATGKPSAYAQSGLMAPQVYDRSLSYCKSYDGGGYTLIGGYHTLTISNPKNFPLVFYSTDGFDCSQDSTINPPYGYNGVSGSSSASSFTLPAPFQAPCNAKQCCTVIVCNLTDTTKTCSFGVASAFYAVPAKEVVAVGLSHTSTPSASPTPTITVGHAPETGTATATSTSTSSASVSPTPGLPSSSPSVTPTPSITPIPPTTNTDWDPREDDTYGVCYRGPVLDQGTCGSCYAHAAAHVLSISLCRSAIDAGYPPRYIQVSAQLLLAIQKSQGNASAATVCAGGAAQALLLTYALNVHPRLASTISPAALLTCKPDYNGVPCAAGCNPYTAGPCPAPVGGVVNPAGATDDINCANMYLDENLCPSLGNALDADTQFLTKAAAAWLPVPSFADPAFPMPTTGLPYYFDQDVTPNIAWNDTRREGTRDYQDAWSAADIEVVKKYLRTRGPMSLSLSACIDWQATVSNTDDKVNGLCGYFPGVSTNDKVNTQFVGVLGESTTAGTCATGNTTSGGMGRRALEELMSAEETGRKLQYDTMGDLVKRSSAQVVADLSSALGDATVADLVKKMGAAAVSDLVKQLGPAVTVDLVKRLGSVAASDLVQKMGARQTADLIHKMGARQSADLIFKMGAHQTADLVRKLGVQQTADLVVTLGMPAEAVGRMYSGVNASSGYCYTCGGIAFNNSFQYSTSPCFFGPAIKSPYSRVAYTGPSCTGSTNHAVTLIGYRTVPNANGVPTPSWIIRNSWGSGVHEAGDFFVAISRGSDNTPGTLGGMAMSKIVGLQFQVPGVVGKLQQRELWAEGNGATPPRQLTAGHVHAAIHRRLKAAASGVDPFPNGGTPSNCSADASAVATATPLAKSHFDTALQRSCGTSTSCASLQYTSFAIHTLYCQSVGMGTIFKAAVSGVNPTTGARDTTHLTFLHSFRGVAPPTPAPVPGSTLPSPSDDDNQDDDYYAYQPYTDDDALAATSGKGPVDIVPGKSGHAVNTIGTAGKRALAEAAAAAVAQERGEEGVEGSESGEGNGQSPLHAKRALLSAKKVSSLLSAKRLSDLGPFQCLVSTVTLTPTPSPLSISLSTSAIVPGEAGNSALSSNAVPGATGNSLSNPLVLPFRLNPPPFFLPTLPIFI